MIRSLTVLLLLLLTTAGSAYSACDCASTDVGSPCTGTGITVTVTAGTPNGGTANDGVYVWAFNSGGGAATCGQFANGDYWVAPASGQSSVTITGITTTSLGSITADADPGTGSTGLGGGSYSNYDADENIIPSLPIAYSATTSLVAAIQRNEAEVGNCGTSAIVGDCIDSYNVLTVLAEVPTLCGSNSLRPNITGASKELLSLSSLDLTRLPSSDLFTGTDTAGLESTRQRWSHSTEIFGLGWSKDEWATSYSNSEAGRAFRSHTLIDDYGAGAAKALHDNLAVIFSDDHTTEAKTPALAAILTYGLDIYHTVFNPPTGYSTKIGTGAGQHAGKATAMYLLAALEPNNATRLNNVKSIATWTNLIQPQELAQIHEGPNGPVWGDDEGITRYWNDYNWANCYDGATGVCDTSVGKRTAADPHKLIDGPANKPGTSYFGISLSGIINFAGVMMAMPEFYAAVDTTKSITLANRALKSGLKTLPDPCVNRDTREAVDCSVWTAGANCDYYYPTAAITPTWGPKSLSDYDAGCGDVEDAPYAVAGRFASLHGTTAEVHSSYVSAQFQNNWDALVASILPRQRYRLGTALLLSQPAEP